MRKLIDIQDENLIPLKVLAIKEDTEMKNYIQDILVYHVKKGK